MNHLGTLQSRIEISNASRNTSPEKSGTISETAQHIGADAVMIVKNAPRDENQAIAYYIKSFKELLEGENSKYTCASKMGAFVVFCLYQYNPWRTGDYDVFREWGRGAELNNEEMAFAWSFVREFEQWEPATPESYAFIITLDRAIIRGARVGAASLDVEPFIRWLERNREIFQNGDELLARVNECAAVLRHPTDSVTDKRAARTEIEHIGQVVLRDVGRIYGRSGLNSVRRQVGAPPSARRPSHLALGALYSNDVFKLSERYLVLSASEREAFKCILNKLDTGESLNKLCEGNPDEAEDPTLEPRS